MDGLLVDLKRHLRLDTEEPDEYNDPLLSDLLASGQAYLNGLAGGELDYAKHIPKQMLINYCRYAYHDATELFVQSFASDILTMQLLYATRSGDVSD